MTTLCRLSEMSTKEFNTFKKKVVKFKVEDNQLFCQNSKNLLIYLVVDNPTKRHIIFEQLYDKSSHKGREDTY